MRSGVAPRIVHEVLQQRPSQQEGDGGGGGGTGAVLLRLSYPAEILDDDDDHHGATTVWKTTTTVLLPRGGVRYLRDEDLVAFHCLHVRRVTRAGAARLSSLTLTVSRRRPRRAVRHIEGGDDAPPLRRSRATRKRKRCS